MTGSLDSDVYDEGELCIDEGPPLPCFSFQDMPLDLTISKSRGKSNQSDVTNHGGLRVRTDLIGPTIVNEGTVLDLSMSNRRRPGSDGGIHQPGNESEECDYSSRELTVPSSSARQPFGIRALMGLTSASTSPLSDRSSSPLQYPILFTPPQTSQLISPSPSLSPGSSRGEASSPKAFPTAVLSRFRESVASAAMARYRDKQQTNVPMLISRQQQIVSEKNLRLNEINKKYVTKAKSEFYSASSTPPPLISYKPKAPPTPPPLKPSSDDVKKPTIDEAKRVSKSDIVVSDNNAEENDSSSTPPLTNTCGIWNLTEKDMEKMFEPYITQTDKKFCCTICSTKFANRDKVISHIENKHIDCFQYKCPQCRTTKTSRLAFDCHIRSRHAADKSLKPRLRLKRQFFIKEDRSKGGAKERNGDKSTENPKSGKFKKRESYDLLFVTFLRNELNGSSPSNNDESAAGGQQTGSYQSGGQQPSSYQPVSQQTRPIMSVATTYLNSPATTTINNNNSKVGFYGSSTYLYPRGSPISPLVSTPPPPLISSPSIASSSSSSPSPSREGSVSPPGLTGSKRTSEEDSIASWINKDQGMFVIKEKQKFALKWFQVKGQASGSWQDLQEQVLSIFQARNLIKVISERPAVFQVFCIRQLLQ